MTYARGRTNNFPSLFSGSMSLKLKESLGQESVWKSLTHFVGWGEEAPALGLGWVKGFAALILHENSSF